MRTNLIQSRRYQSTRDAFTLTELLVVIGMIGLLAVMMAPAFAGNRTDSSAFRCMNNLRQMQVGWTAYSNDNAGKICPTSATGGGGPNPRTWCGDSRMDIAGSDVDSSPIKQGLLWPYINSLPAYKCPADPKTSQLVPHPPTVRSICCNAWMNPAMSPAQAGLSGPAQVFRRQSDISSAFSPSLCWVFIDENEKTINDGLLVVSANPNSGPNNNTWIDAPAVYHDKACGISFADGRAEMKRWRDKNVTGSNPVLFMAADPANNYADLRWLQSHTTVPQ